MTEECIKDIPRTSAKDDQTVHLKFFSPYSGWTWYLTQLDVDTGDAFGIVRGFEVELGRFNVFELADIRFEQLGNVPAVERDLYWQKRTLKEVKEALADEIIL